MTPARLARILVFGAALAAAATAAVAQERGGPSGRGGTPGAFDFYVLALSWSPGFCTATGDSRGSAQCQAGRKLGFVVHGLWPQYEHGYPSNCAGGRNAPRYAIEEAERVYPDSGLARHEWRTHGTCSGLSPTAYFAAVREARAKVTIPDPLANLAQDGQTTPQNIERAFTAVNAGLRPDAMSVVCRRGALQEVRICMDRDLRGFRACPEVDQQACRFGPIRVEAPR
jgi:ribonuclease T2